MNLVMIGEHTDITNVKKRKTQFAKWIDWYYLNIREIHYEKYMVNIICLTICLFK